MAQSYVKHIGKTLEEFSVARKENPAFNTKDFFEFAQKNKNKYALIKTNDDLLVSTWYYDDLVRDYQNTLKPSIENVTLKINDQEITLTQFIEENSHDESISIKDIKNIINLTPGESIHIGITEIIKVK